MKPIKIEVFWNLTRWIVRTTWPTGKVIEMSIPMAVMATDPLGEPSIKRQIIREGYAAGVTIEAGEVSCDVLNGMWEKVDRTPGDRIRRQRYALGLTQTEAAARAGWKQPRWCDLEQNRTKAGMDTLRRVAIVLGCKITDLIDDV